MPQVGSIRELARRVNRSDRAVRKWLNHRRFAVQRHAPKSDADVATIRTWAATLNPNHADPAVRASAARAVADDESAKEHWLMRKYRAQALRAESQLVNHRAAVQHMLSVLNRTRAVLLPRQYPKKTK